MYIALYSAQNVQSVLFQEDGYDSLGFLSNAFAYAGQGTGSVFCVWIIMKIGAEKSMARFALLNMPFLVCLLLPAYKSIKEYREADPFWLSDGMVYPVIILTSIINGFAMGIVQPASGNYVADCATEENKGFYFAFFWSFYMGSQIFGSLIAAFVLGNFDQRYYVLLMLGIALGSALLLFLLKEPVVHHEHLHQEDTHHNVNLEGIVRGGGTAAVTLKGGVKRLWGLAKDPRFKWIVPQTLWTGASIAYFSGNLVDMI
jgi:MFS family permease